MAWIELGYHRGWRIYWETATHKMYAKDGGIFAATHHFYERPNDRATAYAVAKAWIEER